MFGLYNKCRWPSLYNKCRWPSHREHTTGKYLAVNRTTSFLSVYMFYIRFFACTRQKRPRISRMLRSNVFFTLKILKKSIEYCVFRLSLGTCGLRVSTTMGCAAAVRKLRRQSCRTRCVGGGGTFVKNKNHLSFVIYVYYHIDGGGGGDGGGRWHWVFGVIGLRSRRYTISVVITTGPPIYTGEQLILLSFVFFRVSPPTTVAPHRRPTDKVAYIWRIYTKRKCDLRRQKSLLRVYK